MIKVGPGRVTVLARRPEQAAQLVAELGAALPDAELTAGPLSAAAAVADGVYHPVIVNTTPLGMAGANAGYSPWPAAPLTPLLRQAQAAGARFANGLGMLVNQAAEAFELWTNHKPDRDVMRRAVIL